MSSFWQFFDSQMAIFRSVRSLVRSHGIDHKVSNNELDYYSTKTNLNVIGWLGAVIDKELSNENSKIYKFFTYYCQSWLLLLILPNQS